MTPYEEPCSERAFCRSTRRHPSGRRLPACDSAHTAGADGLDELKADEVLAQIPVVMRTSTEAEHDFVSVL